MNGTETDRWRVDRHIPLATILAIMAQTVAIVWWASGIDHRVGALETFAGKTEETRYTNRDADRDKLLADLKIEELRRRINRLEHERGSALKAGTTKLR